MREGRDPFLLSDDNGVYGICLGCDFTAEHEWGIDRLNRKFGIDSTKEAGIARRSITGLPREDDLHLANDTLVCIPRWQFEKDPEKPCAWLRTPFGDEEFRAAWDEKEFAIVAFSVRAKAFVQELYEAFKRLDVAMWVGSSSALSLKTAGLVIAVASKIPELGLTTMAESDLDRDALKKAAAETGIAERLRGAGRGYYALSPKWCREIKNHSETKHPVVFFLNPMEQQENDFGWFTVEELDAWIAGEGPIPRKRERKRS